MQSVLKIYLIVSSIKTGGRIVLQANSQLKGKTFFFRESVESTGLHIKFSE